MHELLVDYARLLADGQNLTAERDALLRLGVRDRASTSIKDSPVETGNAPASSRY